MRRTWADRSGEYSPEYYAYYGADETSESVRDILQTYAGGDASVLELGCSSGRHLAHLLEHGFDDLAGVELNADAFDVMAEHYPDLHREGTFYPDAIEDAVAQMDDDAFDAVFSVETLQHIHPDAEWVFAEVARITRDLLVTVETEEEVGDDGWDRAEGDPRDSEGSDDPDVNFVREAVPLYYRDWQSVFSPLGFEQVDRRESKRETIRTFRAR